VSLYGPLLGKFLRVPFTSLTAHQLHELV